MPEAAIAPPPAKPAAPPPKPSAPAQRQERPAPPPRKEDTSHFDDAYADLDKIEAKDTASKAPRKQDKKPDTKDEREIGEEFDASDAEAIQKDEGKSGKDKAKEGADEKGEKESVEAEAKPVRAAELRTAYEKSKASLKEKDAEITRLKGELESKAKTSDPEKSALVEKLSTTEKKLKEYEDEIRFTNYKNHPEFKEKFEAPYHSAFAKALADFEQIHVTDDEGNKRLATRGDLDSMLRMSIAQVDELATEKFGHSAARVIRHVEKLRDLADAYHGALEEAKTKGGEREKNKAVEMTQQNEQRHKMWTDENDAVAKKYPHWFSPKEGDDEANAKLAKGYELADTVFLRRDSVPPEKLVKLDAAVRNKAAGFDRLVLEGKRKDARIAELEKSLKEFEDSEPSADGDEPAKNEGGGNWEESAFAELEAIDRKSKR